MNPKLLLFLVLLCFPNQQVCLASGFRLNGFGKFLDRLETAIDAANLFCNILGAIHSNNNCSSLNPAVYHTKDTDDSTMPDVSSGMLVINVFVGGGASPQTVPLIVDTTLDYTYMLCQCGGSCSTDFPVYDPSLSNSASNYTCLKSDCPGTQTQTQDISCSNGYCTYNYTDVYASSDGGLMNDKFDISPNPFTFGCGETNSGNYGASLGYLGLGAGELSLLNQTGNEAFSYCLSSSGDGVLLWGSSSELVNSTSQSTTLLTNLLVPSLYYVNFTGISIGGQEADIPSNAYLPQPDGMGGMFLDTTTTISGLEESAYYAMKDEFVNQMGSPTQVDASPYGLDLCFALSPGEQITIPQLTLHFNGADFSPNSDLYFQENENSTVGCLLVIPLQGVSILGLWMQLDTQMTYDIWYGNLHFESANCSSLVNIGV